MSSLMEKIRKNSTIKDAETLDQSKFFDKDIVPLNVPALNVALCGALDGGFYPGLTLWAGPSKHFKSMFSLIMAKAYMDKYPDAVCIFYDCEFGTPIAYFDSLEMDKSRILHTPIMNMEEFKFDVIKHLENLKRGDRVIFVVDSLGNMASCKEMTDAIEGKSVQDMSRAKQMKSIFRMITPYLVKLNVPMVAVAHIYMTQEIFSRPILSGGCLAKGTKIIGEDGIRVNIEDVRVGDVVRTIDGVRYVSRTWTPETLLDGTPECFEIEFEDGYKVVCSDAHEFLVNGEWVEAKDLIVGMDCTTV